MRVCKLRIDLAGSNMGAKWLNVEVTVETDWSDQRLRWEAAAHYAVPLHQVSEPLEVRPQP